MDPADVRRILAGFSIAALLSASVTLPGCSSS
ncbi:MAG TPA: SbtA family thio(seleno)oxazole RiPP natural product precursor [Thermodesulfovibrionales bacterium]|nr:SbtA family thio(seleno)oxazole RiPP natural product precursor [Thermodesulfovibrionales bacterium]